MKRITALILLAGFTYPAWAQSTPDPMTPIQAHPGTQQDIAPNAPENTTQVAAPTVAATKKAPTEKAKVHKHSNKQNVKEDTSKPKTN